MIHTQFSTLAQKKQRGFLMIDILLGMSALMVVLTIWARWQNTAYIELQAKTAREKIEYIIDKSQQYYIARVIVDGNSTTDTSNYPSDYETLTDAGYIDECSEADEIAHECIDYSDLPIAGGETVEFAVSLDADGTWPVLELSVSVGSETDSRKYNLIIKELSQIPGYAMDDTTITITTSRPGSALAYEGVVLTDGTHPMVDDWDFGGYVLDNVEDISFTDLTDRTAITGMVKNGSEYIDSSTGVSVEQPSCPSGYTPTITTYYIGTGGSTQYAEVSNIDTWWEDNGNDTWTIFTRFIGRSISDSDLSFIYQGNVGYFTWCDL